MSALLALWLAAAVPAAAQTIDPCVPLQSSTSNGGEYGFVLDASACPMRQEPPGFARRVADFYARYGGPAPTRYDVYEYVYRITNTGPNAIVLNLDAPNWLRSPAPEILQGFELEIPAGRTYVLSYAATIRPVFLESSAFVGIRHWKSPGALAVRPFTAAGGSGVSLYCPESFTPFETLQNGLLPPVKAARAP